MSHVYIKQRHELRPCYSCVCLNPLQKESPPELRSYHCIPPKIFRFDQQLSDGASWPEKIFIYCVIKFNYSTLSVGENPLWISGYIQLRRLKFRHRRFVCGIWPGGATTWGVIFPWPSWTLLWRPFGYWFHRQEKIFIRIYSYFALQIL